jgi:hypothetical protein
VKRAFGDYVKVDGLEHPRYVLVGAITSECVIVTTDPSYGETSKDGFTASVHVVHRDLLYTDLEQTLVEDGRCESKWIPYVCRLLSGACTFGRMDNAMGMLYLESGFRRTAELPHSEEQVAAIMKNLEDAAALQAQSDAVVEANRVRELEESDARKAKVESEATARRVMEEMWVSKKAKLLEEALAGAKDAQDIATTHTKNQLASVNRRVTQLKTKVR